MVSMGFKIDYVKDMVFNLLNLAWMLWGQGKIFATHFEIAAMIDQPIKCVFDNATARGQEIQSHCNYAGDDGYFIPVDTWASEKFQFDFLGITGCIAFGLYTVGLLVFLVYMYTQIFYAAENEDERHQIQTTLDASRAMFILIISQLSLNYFMLYARVLNKLSAFGVWQHVDPLHEVKLKVTTAQSQISDAENWDFESLVPDLSILFEWDSPGDPEHPQYVGAYVHSFVVFMVMTLTKNVFVVVVTALTDDLHIMSLMFAGIPALMVLALFWFPYFAALMVFKNVDYCFCLDFELDFGPVQQRALYGGLLFGGFSLFPAFAQQVLQAFTQTAHSYEKWLVEKRKEDENFEPDIFNKEWYTICLRKFKIHTPCICGCTSVVGVIGLSCLGTAANEVDQDFVWRPFHTALIMWGLVQGLTLVSSILLAVCGPELTAEDVSTLGPSPEIVGSNI